ncbi:hypothetical protein BV20DRAFT_403090 [Pilatotrama ljubarskyi]|nr:hypothetical protein BV20DRAFT_403090 [Pilatotrama ljubarskyi]
MQVLKRDGQCAEGAMAMKERGEREAHRQGVEDVRMWTGSTRLASHRSILSQVRQPPPLGPIASPQPSPPPPRPSLDLPAAFHRYIVRPDDQRASRSLPASFRPQRLPPTPENIAELGHRLTALLSTHSPSLRTLLPTLLGSIWLSRRRFPQVDGIPKPAQSGDGLAIGNHNQRGPQRRICARSLGLRCLSKSRREEDAGAAVNNINHTSSYRTHPELQLATSSCLCSLQRRLPIGNATRHIGSRPLSFPLTANRRTPSPCAAFYRLSHSCVMFCAKLRPPS